MAKALRNGGVRVTEQKLGNIKLEIDLGTAEGKPSNSGKSLVLFADKSRYVMEDGREAVIQITAYVPM